MRRSWLRCRRCSSRGGWRVRDRRAGSSSRPSPRLVGAPHALAVNNCTAGLHLALLSPWASARATRSSSPTTPIPATGHAVLYCGATPALRRRPPGHLDHRRGGRRRARQRAHRRDRGGRLLRAVRRLRRAAGPDGPSRACSWWRTQPARPVPATTAHRPATALADVAAFSLHGRKGITSGEGGVVTTGSDDVAAFVRQAPVLRRGVGTVPGRVQGPAGAGRSTSWATTTSCPTSAAPWPASRWTASPAWSTPAARWPTATRSCSATSDLVRTPVALEDREHVWQSYVLTLDPSGRPWCHGRGPARPRHRLQLRHLCLQRAARLRRHGPLSGVGSSLFHRHLAIPMHANLTEEQVERVAQGVLAAASAATA